MVFTRLLIPNRLASADAPSTSQSAPSVSKTNYVMIDFSF